MVTCRLYGRNFPKLSSLEVRCGSCSLDCSNACVRSAPDALGMYQSKLEAHRLLFAQIMAMRPEEVIVTLVTASRPE